MSTSNSIRRAVRYALLTSAAAASLPAYAQDQTIQEVVVTGSRIAQPNLETTSPVTQVTAEDVITQGVTKIEDLVNQLPQAFAAQNATVANGATGTATVNLRGLGSTRTLVLVDGRRMPYGGVTSDSAAADLNQIPTALVERVEVLTGGASAVYGSDAIAGVVNFIMKKDFEGVQIDAQYSLYQHNNDFGGPGAVPLRDVIAGKAATNPAQFALPDDDVTDGNSVQGTITHRRQHGRRPRQHHGLRCLPGQQASAAAGSRLLGVLARPATRRCRSPAVAPARRSRARSPTSCDDGGRQLHGRRDQRQYFRDRSTPTRTSTTSARSTTTCVPTRVTAWARWAITSWLSSRTSTRS